MNVPAPFARVLGLPRYVKLGLAGALALVAVAAAAGVLVLAGAGDDGPGPDTVASEPTKRATLTAVPAATSTSEAAPTPTFPPAPPDSESGGDRPIGPAPAIQYGAIAENANASPEFLQLREQLVREIDGYRARTGGMDVAVAVTDLQNGQTISVNGNRPQRTGCTINMFALLALVGEFEAGRARPADVDYNIRIGIGASYPPEVMRFLQTAFGDYHRGEARAREMMSSWGMQASLFDHVPYYGNGTQNNLLTALETNLVLGKLYRGQLFGGEWNAFALARLRDIKPTLNYIIPGHLPAGAVVAHKIGYYADIDGWVVADAGIVTFTGRDGRQGSYAITYLSQRAPTEATGAALGARLSRVAWDWFVAHDAAPPPPPTPTEEPTPRPATSTPRPTRTPMPTRTVPAPTRTPTAEPTLAAPTPTVP